MDTQVFIIEETEQFIEWLSALRNPIAKAAVIARIKRAEKGNFGDHKSVGDGVYEMRITTGAGYRIYYAQQGDIIYILLHGGDKSTQPSDIEKAKTLWNALKQHNKETGEDNE